MTWRCWGTKGWPKSRTTFWGIRYGRGWSMAVLTTRCPAVSTLRWTELKLRPYGPLRHLQRPEDPVVSRTSLPDASGHFGPYGGRFVPETLMSALAELEEAYRDAQRDPSFQVELGRLLRHYAGRPTPLYYAKKLSARAGGPRPDGRPSGRIYLKREDLAHTGAPKINNAPGQGVLARRLGKRRVIAETGAGQHGVATATVCAMLGLDCVVYMGAEDVQRQALNVFRMKLLGAEVRPVDAGSRTLKDA